MRVLLVILSLFLLCQLTVGQSPIQIDSLEQKVLTVTDDSTSIAIYKRLYLAYYDSIPNKALEITRTMISLSKANHYPEGQAGGHYLMGHYFVTVGNFDAAFFQLNESFNIGQQLDNPNISLSSLEWISNIHQKKGDLDSALFYVKKSFEIASKYPTIEEAKIARIKLNEGRIYASQGKYEEAIKNYLEADEALKNDTIGVKGTVKSYIGNLYDRLEKYDQAKKYFKQAQAISLEASDRNGFYTLEITLGGIEMAQNNNTRAKEHYLSAYNHFKSVKALPDMASAASHLGYVYIRQENYGLAEQYLIEAVTTYEKIGYLRSLPYAYNGLGELYRKTHQTNKAIASYKKAIDLATSNGTLEYYIDTYPYLVEAYANKEDFENAFFYQSGLMTIKDSLQEKDNLVRIKEIEEKYQNDKQQQEIELLTSQSELAEQKSRNQRNLFIGSISFLGLAFITLFFLFRNKQKTNQRLKELEAAKSKFFANISHEFRTPLTLISGPVAHQLSKEGLSVNDKTDLGLIQRNADRLLKLVNQILDLSKIEAGSRKLRVSKGNMALFLKHLIEPFQYRAQQSEVVLYSEIDVSVEVWFDRDVLEKIVTNLLSNAIKYNDNKGQIDFMATQQGKHVTISTTNQNSNLTAKELPLLFDRFYQNNMMQQGFGIGLSLVQELANLANGTARAYKPDEATIAFEVTLPVSKKSFAKAEIIKEDEILFDYKTPITEVGIETDREVEEVEEGSLPVLLVVDDNEEIRLFIKSLFKNEYKILEAENGKEGEHIALETIPDLIISDVIMPVKNGIELSNTLKNDERTSHIPIVLLTAKSGEENELKGLKTGADSYMVKPFKEEKLRVVIDKLIATRTAIQLKFSKHPFFKERNIELTNVDTRLMKRIRQILDVELTNPEFNAQLFAEQIGLSRMHLHRKLKALIGISTSEFIRVQRLQLAAKLLEDGHDNIAEIGYAVGFNQPAYFTTTFKNHFGCSPSEYVKNQKEI